MRLKVIVFDFDGVLADSNPVKRGAYDRIFRRFKGSKRIIGKVINEFEPNTRAFMIGEIVDRLKRTGQIDSRDTAKQIHGFIKEYGRICEEGISRCPEIKGALKCVQSLSKKYSLYINSLTPIKALSMIIRNRGLALFFKGIMGGENSKTENLIEIIKEENVSPEELLVVGDGANDLESAHAVGAHFIGINSQNSLFKKKDTMYLLSNCSQLGKKIEEMNAEPG